MFKKKTKTENLRPDRIRNMADHDLRGWLNACMMELGSTYDRWQFNRGEGSEVTKVLGLVNDLWNEIQSRP